MKNLIIVGAGGYGREIYNAAQGCLGFGTEFVIKGFLDGNPAALDAFDGYPPILGAPETYTPQTDDVFFGALGNVKTRARCLKPLIEKGAHFQTLIHKEAVIYSHVQIGEGSYIAHHAWLSADVVIGKHSAVFCQAALGHDVRVGDFCHVSVGSFLGGGVRVDDFVTLHPHTKVVPRKTLHAGATVGIGSVVLGHVKADDTVFGSPAESIKPLE